MFNFEKVDELGVSGSNQNQEGGQMRVEEMILAEMQNLLTETLENLEKLELVKDDEATILREKCSKLGAEYREEKALILKNIAQMDNPENLDAAKKVSPIRSQLMDGQMKTIDLIAKELDAINKKIKERLVRYNQAS